MFCHTKWWVFFKIGFIEWFEDFKLGFIGVEVSWRE